MHKEKHFVLSALKVCADGYIWREVRVQVLDLIYDGWMVEGTRQTYDEEGNPLSDSYVDQGGGPPCYPPLGFSVGDLARVEYEDTLPKNLRDTPSYNGNILYTLVKGIPLEIIGGPGCVEGMNWWQVRVMATFEVTGWMGEGGRSNYWIRPFTPHPDQDPYRCCDVADP